MSDRPYFILFRQDNHAVAGMVALLGNYPQSIEHQGRDYQWQDGYLGDFDHLVSPQNDLLGFSFPFFPLDFPEIASSPFVVDCDNVSVEGGPLNVTLSEHSESESDIWLVVDSALYADPLGDIIILAFASWICAKENWGNESLGEIRFPLIENSEDLPRLGEPRPLPPRLSGTS